MLAHNTRGCKISGYAPIPIPDLDAQRSPGRRGGGQPPTDAPFRHDPPFGGRIVHLAAPWLAYAAKSRARRPGGDEPGGGPGTPHAHGAAGRTVAGIGPEGQVRAGTAALPGSARPRVSVPTHGRC